MNETWTKVFPFLRWGPLMTPASLRADALAGFTGAAVVLPQGVAFSTVAGMPPQYGIYTAMVSAIVAALFGSSRVMVSGPNTPLAVVIFATVAPLAVPGTPVYVDLVLQLTVMVGLIQLAAAVARLGAIVSFVSHSVMTGFTAAAAILISVSQLGPALGLHVERGGTVLESLLRLAGSLGSAHWASVAVALNTLLAVALLQRFARAWPGFLIAIVLGSLIGVALGGTAAGVEMVGALPSALPTLVLPGFQISSISDLTQGAMALALVALLQALSIGRTLAIRRRERFSATQEIWGQGLSNLIGGFFQNYVSSGSFTRSGVNEDAGARTAMAAVLSGVFLALMMLLVLPLIAHIPIPAIAGLILYVAWRLIDRREIAHVIRTSRSETAILGLTFTGGLLVELDFAIYLGVIASLLVFLHKSSQPAVAVVAPKLVNGQRKFVDAKDNDLPECPQITIIRLDGTLYFGSVEHVARELRKMRRSHPQQRIKVLILKGVGDIDLAGGDLLIDEIRTLRAQGGDFHMIANFPPLLTRLERLEVSAELGPANLHANKGEAVDAAVQAADNEICRGCRVRLFHECSRKPGARAAMRELGY